MKGTRLASVPLKRLKPSPFNPRHDAEGIEDLAASVAAVGIIEPLVVAIDKDDPEHLTIVCGWRRYNAAKMAKLSEAPCLITPAMTEQQLRLVSMVENLHRRAMSHIEQGEAFRDLIATGLNQIQVARATGVSDATVSMKLTLVRKLIPAFQKMVHKDHMTMAEGLEMAKLPPEEQRRIHAGGRGQQRRKSSAPAKRRTKTELCLMRALQNFREGFPNLALAEAEKAVGYLRNAQKSGKEVA